MQHGSNRHAWLRGRAALAVALAVLCIVSVCGAWSRGGGDVARVGSCSHETGDELETLSSGGTKSIQNTVKRSGNWAARCNPTGSAVGWFRYGTWDPTTGGATTFNAATGRCRGYFNFAALPASASEEIATVKDTAGTLKMAVRVTSTGKLQCYRNNGTTQIGVDSPITVGTSGFYGIEVVCGTGTSADFELWVALPGSDLFELQTSGTVGSGNLGTVNCGSFEAGKSVDRNGQSIDLYVDDIAIDDAVRCGASQFARMLPNADGNATTWTIGAGSGAKWEQLDEDATNTTDYLTSTGTTGDAYTAALVSAATAGVSGKVIAVKSFVSLRRDVSNGLVKLRLRSATTNSDASGTIGTGASFLGRSIMFNTDPATGAAWTVSALDSVEVGAIEQSANPTRMSTAMLMVEFQPATSFSGSSVGESSGSGPFGSNSALAGSSAGESSARAAATVLVALAGASTGEASAQLAATDNAAVAGASSGESSGSAALGAEVSLAGQSTGESAAGGALTSSCAIAGAAYGESASAVVFLSAGGITGSAYGESSVSALLGVDVALAGSAVGESSGVGAFGVDVLFAAPGYGESAASGLFSLASADDFSGSAYGESSAYAIFGVQVAVSGQSTGSSSASALFGGFANIVGASCGESSAWAEFGIDELDLTWTSAGESSATAVFGAEVAIAGSSVGSSSATWLFDDSPPDEGSSAILDVVDAIVAELNATTWSIDLEGAERVFSSDIKLEDLDSISVMVRGVSETPKRVSRGQRIKKVVAEICVRIRPENLIVDGLVDSEKVEPYVRLLHEIADHFDGERLAEIHDAYVETSVGEPPYDEPHLAKLHQFTGVVRLEVADWR